MLGNHFRAHRSRRAFVGVDHELVEVMQCQLLAQIEVASKMPAQSLILVLGVAASQTRFDHRICCNKPDKRTDRAKTPSYRWRSSVEAMTPATMG